MPRTTTRFASNQAHQQKMFGRAVRYFGYNIFHKGCHAIKVKKCVKNMHSIPILSLLKVQALDEPISVKGWVKYVRHHKDISFVHLTDGLSHETLQLIIPHTIISSGIAYGSCIHAFGKLVASTGTKQDVEMQVDSLEIVGSSDPREFPIPVKGLKTLDSIRPYPHLRARTDHIASILRVRNRATQAMHQFFQEQGFTEIHTPLLTSNDCEGAGEVFQVEPADKMLTERISKEEGTQNKHFFDVPTYLTVSAQLHLEAMASALNKVYTISPTFRAENTRTRHHLSEFYMVEAEMAFTQGLHDVMQVIEDLLKQTSESVLSRSQKDVRVCWNKQGSPGDRQKIVGTMINEPFIRMTYKEAIDILEKKNRKFEVKVQWGCDLMKEHERYLVKHCNNVPVFVTDYPASIKPFYARVNEDPLTVAAVDLLCADVGEVCGGSVREERLDVLKCKTSSDLDWYLDLRRFGTFPHGGFGIGLDRYLQVLLGVSNIKDTVPFPRWTHNCKM